MATRPKRKVVSAKAKRARTRISVAERQLRQLKNKIATRSFVTGKDLEDLGIAIARMIPSMPASW